MSNRQKDQLLALLPEWDRFFGGYTPPSILGADAQLSELRMRIINLRRRLRDGPLAPLRIAFFGPTGSGKSKLFSSLIGQNISGSGYRRPYTRQAIYYIHDDWRSLAPALSGQIEQHEDDRWHNAILIDTPDFDSVEESNRAEAERVFLEADGFLFVTDALKYADASTWNYLTRIRQSAKMFSTILNKVNSKEVPESFRERFVDTFGKPKDEEILPEVVVPELALADEDLIPQDHESIRALRRAALRLSAHAGPETSAEMVQSEALGMIEGAAALQQRVGELQATIEDLRRTNRQRLNESKQRLENRLTTGLDPEVRNEVYQRVLKRLEKIDLLRYPRKILSLPIRGLKSLFTGWLPKKEDRLESAAGQESTDPVTSETFHLLESELIRLADDARLDIQRRPGLENLLDRETFQQLKIDHEEAKTLFARHYEDFTGWLAEHARETASEITGENKAKFIISQVLFNTLLITAQVHTGGAFSLLELGLDGVLSPFVAKGVGMAIGNDKVKEFEERAHLHHQQSLGSILQFASDRIDKFLIRCGRDLEPLSQRLDEIVGQRNELQRLVEEFHEQAKRDRDSLSGNKG
jgi:hypothetical protein